MFQIAKVVFNVVPKVVDLFDSFPIDVNVERLKSLPDALNVNGLAAFPFPFQVGASIKNWQHSLFD